MATSPEVTASSLGDRFSTNFVDAEVEPTTFEGEVTTGGVAGVEGEVGFDDDFLADFKKKEEEEGGEERRRFSDDFTGRVLHQASFETEDSSSSHDPILTGGEAATVTVDIEWGTFNSEKKPEDAEPAAVASKPTEQTKTNGTGHVVSPSRSTGSWEQFDDQASAKAIQKKMISVAEDDHGQVCAAAALVGGASQWTALDDSRGKRLHADLSEDADDQFVRKSQSMRATTHRKVQIVDALRTRRLSQSSLDRVPLGQSNFVNEDELTRKFNVDREWQVHVKMNRRVRGTRSKWLAVNISVKAGTLVIRRSVPPSMPVSSSNVSSLSAPPLHEIQLCHNHVLTRPISRSYDRRTKLHQIKLRQTRVREKRTLKRWLFVEHISSARTIVKVGCPDLSVVESLSDQIDEAIRQLPVMRLQGVAYRMNEVFVDIKDNSDILMNCDGAVLERRSLNRVYIQAFLTGSPECKLQLNDVEAALLQPRREIATLSGRQVKLSDVVLHPCVDADVYRSSREIHFHAVDGYPFELLRCSIEPYVSPPVNMSVLMEYSDNMNRVTFTASFQVRKTLNLQHSPISDLLIKFPVPSSWSPLFLASTTFGGKKSVRNTSALRNSFRRKIRSSTCQITTHLGSAKYEPEHAAILWRIGSYTRSSTPHTFRCEVQLKPGEW